MQKYLRSYDVNYLVKINQGNRHADLERNQQNEIGDSINHQKPPRQAIFLYKTINDMLNASNRLSFHHCIAVA